MIIEFTENKPSQYFYSYSVIGNENSDIIELIFSTIQSGIDLSDATPRIKVVASDENYADILSILDSVVNDEKIHIYWTLKQPVTLCKNIDVQVEFTTSEQLWQSEIFNLTLDNRLMVEEAIEKIYPSVLDEKAEVITHPMHFDFPNVGDVKNIYIASKENRTYRYDANLGKYYCVGANYDDITIIKIEGEK